MAWHGMMGMLILGSAPDLESGSSAIPKIAKIPHVLQTQGKKDINK